MKIKNDKENRKPPAPKIWYRRLDYILGVIIGALLYAFLNWYVNNPNSLGYWRSFQ